MSARAMRAPRLALSSLRTPLARRFVSAHQGPTAKPGGSDLPWMVGSAAVFGPTFFYLLGPSAPGKHEGHEDHADHKDAGRGLFRGPSREPKWTEEDEELDRLRSKGEDGDDEEEEGAEATDDDSSSEESEDGPETPAESDNEDGEEEKRPQQADANKPEANRTPRRADPDKLRFAQEHQQKTASERGHVDPKQMIQEFSEKKAAGETAGEDALAGKRTDEMATQDPLSDDAKQNQKKSS